MSYSKTLIVGWYVDFKPTETKFNVGEEKIKYCPTSKKHPNNGKFCPTCGSEIIYETKTKYAKYPHPIHLLEITDQEELDDYTYGNVQIKDLNILKGSRAIFPEFINTKNNIIYAPGYKSFKELGHSDGFVYSLDIDKFPPPSIAWVEAIKRVFDVTDVDIKYGLTFELW